MNLTLNNLTPKIQPRYVTVKDPNLDRYIVEPGEKVDGLGLDGVVQIKFLGEVECTGALLPTGKHILVAGHCLYEEIAKDIKVTFELPTGDVTIPAHELFIHPQYNDDTLANDVAIIELSQVAPFTAQRYEIYRQQDEIGKKHIKVGYGDSGQGQAKNVYDDRKRVGFNLYDDDANQINDKFLFTENLPKNKQLAYDFDNGTRTRDAFGQIFGIWNTGLGVDEVNSAPGDSGGPTFIDGKIAGITSYGFGKDGGVKTDVDSLTNSSFGEFSIDTRVSAYSNWIDSILNPSASNSSESPDFNQDGNVDIVWNNVTNGNNKVWLMDGIQKEEIVKLKSRPNTNWEIGGTGDFNGDEKEDILWRNYATGANQVWLMNGTRYQSTVNLKSRSNTNWEIGETGDFNGDEKDDLLWRNYATGANQVWLLNNTQLNQVVNLLSRPNPDWEIVGSADFNSNQSDDILWRNYATGANQIWFMDGTQRVSTANLPSWTNTNWEAII